MAQMTPVVNSFNAGEFSPLLEGRSDLQKYGSACQLLENFLIQPYGGVTRRSGTQYVAPAKYSDKKCRLVPFEFSVIQAYHLEFGNEYIRFFKDGAQITKTSPAAWLTGTNYVVGNFVTQTAVSYYCIEAHTAGTFATDLAASKWVAQTVYEIPSPYLEADLPGIQFVQSADVMFLVHPSYAPRKLSRLGHDNWTLELFVFENGPFLDENVTTTTITPSYPAWVTATAYVIGNHVTVTGVTYVAITNHTSGAPNPTPPGNTTDWRVVYQYGGNNMILTASANTFLAGHVGSLFRIRHLRTNAAQSGELAATAGVESVIFPVYGSWRFTTRGTWTATIEIQRSFDNGLTWITYQTYTSAGDFNTNTTGEEIERNVLYKIKRITTGSSVCPWMFNIEETYYDGVVKILTVASATSATAEVQNYLGQLTATTLWSEGAWSIVQGWPGCVAFFEQRLMFAATTQRPQTVWGSKSGTFTDFQPGVLDDDAISYTIGADRVNVIRWMQPQTQLLLGTTAGEWKMGGSDIGEPITPTNVSIRRQSTYGSINIQAALVNDVVLFLQRQGRKIREMTLDPANVQDKYVAPDMTILAEHITESGIVAIAYQQQPDSILWCVRADGELAGMTYERDQDVVGWHRHVTDGQFESISIIPGTDEDEIAVVVQRLINGNVVRYIEIFAPRDFGTDQTDAFYVDSGLSFDGGISQAISSAQIVTGAGVGRVQINLNSHGFLDGQQLLIEGVVGMTELNGIVFTVALKQPNYFYLKDSTNTEYIDGFGDLARMKTVGFWKLNDDAASTVVLTGYNVGNGTSVRNTALISQPGKIGKCFLLDSASSDAVSFGTLTAFDIETRATSWSFWCKANTGETGVFFHLGYNTATRGWKIQVKPDEIRWANVDDSKEITAAVTLADETWYHIVVVRNGANSKIVLNNVELTLATNTDALEDISILAVAGLYLGLDAATTTYYSGSVDSIMMFNSALSAYDVGLLWNGGAGQEDFGFNDYISGGTVQRVENTFTNLAHLEAKVCDVLADGGVHPQVTVASGTATLEFFANKVHIGLPYQSNLVPTRFVFSADGGSSAARRKRIHEVFIRFYQTLNGKIGRDADNLDPIIFGQYTDLMGSPPVLFTGDKWIQLNGDISNDSNLYVRADTPTPMTILALMLKMAMTE